jgi:hypothetical protein
MNCKKEILTIPRGNDFRIHLCLADVTPSAPDGVTFADIEGMQAYLVRFPNIRYDIGYELTDNGDIRIIVPADAQICTKYGIEMVGTYEGQSWRFKCSDAFRIADSNCESSVQGMETFGEEVYYIFDTLEFEIVGDTLHIYTDGHASLANGTLSLQETDGTSLGVKRDSIIATETKNHR